MSANTETERFIKFMKEKRTLLGWTPQTLAIKAFNDPTRRSYISGLEQGRRKGLTLESASQILKALDTEISYIESEP